MLRTERIVTLRECLRSAAGFPMIPGAGNNAAVPLLRCHQLTKGSRLQKTGKLMHLNAGVLENINICNGRYGDVCFVISQNRIFGIPAHIRKQQGLHERHIVSILIPRISLIRHIPVHILIHRLDFGIRQKLLLRLHSMVRL